MNAKMFFALALSAPMFVSSAEAIVYTVRTDSGPVTYSLEVPPGTPVGHKIKPQVGYSANFPMTAGSAEVVAVRWAAGLKDKDKSDNYPNSLTILGGKIPGGFYNATFTKPTSVQRIKRSGSLLSGPNARERRRQRADFLCRGARRRESRSPSTSESIRLPPSSPFSGKVGWAPERKKKRESGRVLGETAGGREMGGAGLKENGEFPKRNLRTSLNR